MKRNFISKQKKILGNIAWWTVDCQQEIMNEVKHLCESLCRSRNLKTYEISVLKERIPQPLCQGKAFLKEGITSGETDMAKSKQTNKQTNKQTKTITVKKSGEKSRLR